MESTSPCLTDSDLEAILLDRCSPEQSAAWEEHLETCESCRTRLYEPGQALRERFAVNESDVSGASNPLVDHQSTPHRLISSVDVTSESADDPPQGSIADAPFQSKSNVRTRRVTGDPTSRSGKRLDGQDADELPQFPGYTTIREIGRGGMAIVYLARHIRMKRMVALKVLNVASRHHPERWIRFRNESATIARLQHPNIVRVFDSGEHEGAPFFVQELAQPQSLHDRIEIGPPPAHRTATIMRFLADATAHAHQQGVVHRDIKPSNVLFREGDDEDSFSGEPMLADFGLAKLIDDDTELTRSRDVIGTPAYMSPEQANGKSAGPLSDVFSLGVLMYELLTGTQPFKGASTVETLDRICEHEPVPPRRLQPGVPRDLAVICLKCMEKSPANRYRDAAALRDDLKRFLDGRPIIARPASHFQRAVKWCRRNPAIAACSVLASICLLSLLIVWAWMTGEITKQRNAAIANATTAEENALEARENEKIAKDRLLEKQQALEASDQAVAFLATSMFDAVSSGSKGAQLTVVEVMQRSAERIDKEFSSHPRIEATLRTAIGNSYYQMGNPVVALPHLERAVTLYQQLDDTEPTRTEAAAHFSFAVCHSQLGNQEKYKKHIRRVAQSKWSEHQDFWGELAYTEAKNLLKNGDVDAAFKLLDKIDSSEGKNPSAPPHTIAKSLATRVAHYIKTGQTEKMIVEAERAVQFTSQRFEETHPQHLSALHNLAMVRVRQKRFQDAIKIQRDLLQKKQDWFGQNSIDVAGTLNNLGSALWRGGQHDEAIATLLRSFDTHVAIGRDTAHDCLETLFNVGRMSETIGKHKRGADAYDEKLRPRFEKRTDTGQWRALMQTYIRLKIGAGEMDDAQSLLDDERKWLAENSDRNSEDGNSEDAAKLQKALDKLQEQIDAARE